MKKLLFLLVIFCVQQANAQNYLISFAGTGGSSTVSTVNVENLTAGTSLILNGSDVLRLTIPTGVNSIENKQSSELKIYPNPMTGNSVLQVYPPAEGSAVITLFDMAGKQVAQLQSFLENYPQEFCLSGINRGLYLISVKGKTYQYSGKLLCNGKVDGTISIEKISNNQAANVKTGKKDSKGTQATVDMAYTTGARLKYTGLSGIYSTVVTDIPSSNKTITFNFIACIDGDNNNYPIVNIGTQTWMAANLETTKYKDGVTTIPLVTDNTAWSNLTSAGYCWYNNNEATYKATYGALYNWYTTSTGNLCPTGWHVPTDAEWTTLTDYLTNHGYGYGGIAINIAKSVAATLGWATDGTAGNVGNDQASNNSSGFTALPGGYRGLNGAFDHVSLYGYWWSSTEYFITSYAYDRAMSYNSSNVSSYFTNKLFGWSVRCVKDN